MSWDLVQWAVAANDTADAVAALERDEQVAVITVPIPDVVHALISGEDLEAEGEWDNPVEAAATFGGDDMVGERILVEPGTVAAVSVWLGEHSPEELLRQNAQVVAARLGGPPTPEIADHLKALYAEIRDFYAAASAKNAYVLKWPS